MLSLQLWRLVRPTRQDNTEAGREGATEQHRQPSCQLSQYKTDSVVKLFSSHVPRHWYHLSAFPDLNGRPQL